MNDASGLAVVVRIRAARLAGLERQLSEAIAGAAEAGRKVQLAEAMVSHLTIIATSRIAAERDTLLSAPFQIEMLAAYKRAREQSDNEIAEAKRLLNAAIGHFGSLEMIRRELARKVLIERSRKEHLDKNLAAMLRARANRLESRRIDEFGEGKRLES